jgi:hypothetical protein
MKGIFVELLLAVAALPAFAHDRGLVEAQIHATAAGAIATCPAHAHVPAYSAAVVSCLLFTETEAEHWTAAPIVGQVGVTADVLSIRRWPPFVFADIVFRNPTGAPLIVESRITLVYHAPAPARAAARPR